MPTKRMGPPPGALPPMRMTASWSGSERTYRIQVRGAKKCRNGELPSDLKGHTGTVQDAEAMQKARLAVHHRSANLIVGDGTKNGLPAPNKEPTTNQK